MLEAELSFADMEVAMDSAERSIRYASEKVLSSQPQDLDFLKKSREVDLFSRLEILASKTFQKIMYTEAIELLSKEGIDTSWGAPLSTDHERWLAEYFKG
jgi:asparaginyl-tRNA synthetase